MLLRNATDEPIGRWENRCDFAWKISLHQFMLCDRPREHKGLHRGRIWYFPGDEKDPSAHVRGYGAHR
jgi:hypothetical protein